MPARDLSRPLTRVSWIVPGAAAGLRLDHWLRERAPWRSRNDLQRRIAGGRVLVDDTPARKALRLRAGQKVAILVDEGPAAEPVPLERIPLRVIWEDPWLVALDKAPGTVVHPVGRHVTDTVINAVHLRYRATGVRPLIVHRLDRDTSGVLVLAKDMASRRLLGRAFEERRVQKTYLALTAGRPRPGHGVLDRPIGPDPESGIRLKVACVPDGKPSRTGYRVLASPGAFSLVRCSPHTGRQHQIRVHLADAGHPILGDRLYGTPPPLYRGDLGLPGNPRDPVLHRQALHAAELSFPHPRTGRRVVLTAPLAPDLAALMEACGARAEEG